MKAKNSSLRNAILFVLALTCVSLAVLGLMASKSRSVYSLDFIIGTGVYICVWLIIAEFIYMSAAHLYGFQRRSLFMFRMSEKFRNVEEIRRWRLASILLCLISYIFTIYGFGIAFLFMSRINPNAFNIGELDLFTAIYFSMITAATVGYGDIIPISRGARSFVIAEIIMSLVYVIFFFSVLSGAIKHPNPKD